MFRYSDIPRVGKIFRVVAKVVFGVYMVFLIVLALKTVNVIFIYWLFNCSNSSIGYDLLCILENFGIRTDYRFDWIE